jgi:hypothetical protein
MRPALEHANSETTGDGTAGFSYGWVIVFASFA